MYATVPTAALLGVETLRVRVECHVHPGMPKVVITGLPDSAIREAIPRVFSATRMQGFPIELTRRVVINLVPGDLRKSGSAFDLPIALGLLAAMGRCDPERLARTLVLGELTLEGRVASVRGILVMVGQDPTGGSRTRPGEVIDEVLVPRENQREAVLGSGWPVVAVGTLKEAVDHLSGEAPLPRLEPGCLEPGDGDTLSAPDLRDVRGQDQARRALEIAAAGGHNLLLVGSPGSGKTLLAHRLPGILPRLAAGEALEVSRVHSVAGLLPPDGSLLSRRPFRAPHASISDAGLLGGARAPHVGELSLAHRGVLFLDEFPEFRRSALEHLRQPLEDGWVQIARAGLSVRLPARITLVAAMNPCPCGFRGDPRRTCRCSPFQVERYTARLSGPILDRIDLQVEVPSLKVEELIDLQEGEESASVRMRVEEAVDRQRFRYRDDPRLFSNAGLERSGLKTWCALDDPGMELLRRAAERFQLSARSIDRVVKVARTIADLRGRDTISRVELAEAVQLRVRDSPVPAPL
jgi:magnesium chelatase family protein